MRNKEARQIALEHVDVYVPRRDQIKALVSWMNGVVLGAAVAGLALGLAFAIAKDGWQKAQVRVEAECLEAQVGRFTPSVKGWNQ